MKKNTCSGLKNLTDSRVSLETFTGSMSVIVFCVLAENGKTGREVGIKAGLFLYWFKSASLDLAFPHRDFVGIIIRRKGIPQ